MKIIKYFYLLMVMFLFFAFNNHFTFAFNDETLSETVDRFMEEKVKERHVPNAVVSIVHDGKVIFEKGYGYLNRENEILVDPETSLFRIGSISKLITWTAVMQLVEQGKLELDRDVNEYIDFNIPELPQSGPITLRHLLTHTPGFEDYSMEIFQLKEENFVPLDEYIKDYLPERIFPAGEVLAYSNYGTALAGYIVQVTSGMPFAKYVEGNIFHKLDMEYSTFEQPVPEHLSEYIVTPYRYIDGTYKQASFECIMEPAGAMSSSAADMAKFMLAFLQEGNYKEEMLLKEETVRKMFEQQFTHHPKMNGMGLGFVRGKVNDKEVYYHEGSTMLFNSGLYLIPEENLGIFISYSGGDYFLHKEVLQLVMDQYFPKDEPDYSEATEQIITNVKQYIGEYHQNRRSITTEEKLLSLVMGTIQVNVDKSGYLNISHMGETNRYVETEPGVFQSVRADESLDPYGYFDTIVFQKDHHGNMMLIADGPMTYTKTPWYESSGVNFLFIGFSLLFMIGTLLFWLISAIVRKIKKKQSETTIFNVIAKWNAIFYGILLILLFVNLLIDGIDPVYQLPKSAYGMEPEWLVIFNIVPYLMTISSIGLTVFTIIVWKRKIGKIINRIHYTIYTGISLLLICFFVYWNIM